MKACELRLQDPGNNPCFQLRPPHRVQMESDRKPSYCLSWQLHNVSHYLEGLLEYEVAYKKLGDLDKAAAILPITYDQQWIEIENLSPGTEYEAVVRVKVQDYSGYKSIWSHWSTTLKWRTYPKELSLLSFLPALLAFGISSISIFLIVAISLVKTRIPKWLQKALKIHLPDPVKFFPSLTAVHGGDVQKWLSSPLSMDSFHITSASSDVSMLEVLQKGSQDPCLLLPKDCFTSMDAPETSGHSLSSCFINRGYFFFHHLHSLEIEPCKVYFTYDPVAQENSGSEDGDSYQALHTTDSHPVLPSYSLMGSQESVSLLPEMKDPTQKVHQIISPASTGRSSPVLATEQGETQKESKAIFPGSISLYQSSMGVSSVHKQPSSNANEMEATTDGATHTHCVGNNTLSFLQPMILKPGKASDVCRTESSSQKVPNSEAYLSLKELQSQYIHQSV
ncbi:interleukin-2 receptor subunit beta [Heteronotia binoei]|uniref:interleukin-2 receptor subunit beta n=1 Tax=Heteronotia binoei TaxID=13085 RepID=UPI00292E4825|nr:interleukin-2 receptor subunit beta [Heteronotia binoei]